MERNELGDRVVNNIRHLRTLKKFSQHQLSAYAKLSTNYINSIERYIFYPSFWHIERIAKALNVPIYKLFEEV